MMPNPMTLLIVDRVKASESPPRSTSRISSRISTRIAATKGVSSVCEPLPADRPLWFPGSSPPEWLDGRQTISNSLHSQLVIFCSLIDFSISCLSCSLPGDFGFDPLGLGEHSAIHWSCQSIYARTSEFSKFPTGLVAQKTCHGSSLRIGPRAPQMVRAG